MTYDPYALTSKQRRVSTWVRTVFSEKEATDVPERALRAVEEVVELAQSVGVDAATLHRLVDYVMGRPAGKPAQEIAGTMVTLYAMAGALGVDADTAFEVELERIQQPEVIERCQRRQHEKREALAAKIEEPAPVMFEDERIDTVRYALRNAIDQHIDRCGAWISLSSLPDETVAEVFLEALGKRSLSVVDSIVAQLGDQLSGKTPADNLVEDSREQLGEFCDDGKTGALR